MRFRPLLSLLPVALVACGHGPKITPVAVVESVYGYQLGSPILGLPSAEQSSYLGRFLGDSLNKLLARARTIQAGEVSAHPDEKPSWADGDLFSSLFEGPTSFHALSPIPGTVTKVPVQFGRDDPGHRLEWVDTILVARRDTMWVVEDVIYGGSWPFAPKGTLRGQLQR